MACGLDGENKKQNTEVETDGRETEAETKIKDRRNIVFNEMKH